MPEDPDLRADFILANPPFNVSAWGGERLRQDARWKYGVPPVSNANFAWVQHIIHHLSPTCTAGFVLANGSLSSNISGEGEIRQRIIEADLVDCVVALPGQLFYTTQIPVCLWFIARDKRNGRFRDRRGNTLFVDARNMGEMISRVQRRLTEDEIAHIARTYHRWRGEDEAASYEDAPGFCRSVRLDEIRANRFVLTPARYVESATIPDDAEPFEARVQRLVSALEEQLSESARLERAIRNGLSGLGYGG